MNQSKEELELLRQYVNTLQNQMKSKNEQIRTLNIQIQNLSKYQSLSNVSRSQVVYTSNCNQCTANKQQLTNLKAKYLSLESSAKLSSYSSFVTTSSTNQQIQYFKREYLKVLDQKRKLQNQSLQRQTRQWSSQSEQLQSALRESKQQIQRLRLQLRKREEIIRQLRFQLMSYSQKISNLERQIQTLARTSNSTQSNSQRLRYVNGQVQHYLALSNSLKSQIQVLKQENHSYIFKIRQLQNRPKQIQYIHVQPSLEIKQSVQELRTEIAELSNNNYLIQKQNQNLRLRLIELSRTKRTQPHIIEVIRTENHSPLRIYMEQERVGRHYRQNNRKENSRVRGLTPKNAVFFEKQKYNDLQRRIYKLQVQNENLKTNFYNKI